MRKKNADLDVSEDFKIFNVLDSWPPNEKIADLDDLEDFNIFNIVDPSPKMRKMQI